jgi:hypothetical protein
LADLHLPSDKFDEYNSIDGENLLRDKSVAKKHDGVEALEGEIRVVLENFVCLHL